MVDASMAVAGLEGGTRARPPAADVDDDPVRIASRVERRRLEANGTLDPRKKSAQGQYMTPYSVARFMASLFRTQEGGEVRLLDAGAGVGSLTAAFVEAWCNRHPPVRRIAVTAYELEPALTGYLRDTLIDCRHRCHQVGLAFDADLLPQDFLEAGAHQLFMGREPSRRFTHAILNPPYKKIHSTSAHRLLLRTLGIETSNLYTGFLAVAIKLLEPGGELVAITPRSFCNGPYFTAFRHFLLDTMALRRIHVFESRKQAFKEDDVLQENIILYAVKHAPQERVTLSQSHGLDFAHVTSRDVDSAEVVSPQDPHRFLHLAVRDDEQRALGHMRAMPCTLQDLGIEASTGPVVDFRLKAYLRQEPEAGTVPLIYPAHCQDNIVTWPQAACRKPNAILDAEPVQKWLYPNGHYTLVRRFSSKEERRRVVAAVHDPDHVPGEKIGFENHLNVLHCHRQGLPQALARGLAVYLNSTFVDRCFRQFNGHTQVNVKDLYTLRYPERNTLIAFGTYVGKQRFPTQEAIDAWMEKALLIHG
jgi:adenine-specific DNA-methyltransferase